jgi:hypothetical protein
MKLGAESVMRLFQLVALSVLLSFVGPSASAQKAAAPPPPPPKKSGAAAAPSHAVPAAPHAAAAASDPAATAAARPASHDSASHSTGNSRTTAGANASGSRPMGNGGNTNHVNNSASKRNAPAPKPAPPSNETTIRDITPNSASGSAGANSKGTGSSAPANGKTAWGAPANKNAANANHVNNQPGTHPLPNGGTRIVKANGSAVEKNKSGKVTAVTTAKGVTVRLDAHGHAATIHDGHGTTISRGPHGERRVESVRADNSRLVSTGHHRGFAEQRFTQGGRDYARRTYYDHGHMFVRVYQPYFYGGYPFYSYVPAFYFGPAYYGWAYGGWAVPVQYTWGWYGSPWFTPYGYYFSPYAAYPAPAFWLADYAIAASLQAGDETGSDDTGSDGTGSSSLRQQAGLVLASARLGDHIGAQIGDQIGDQNGGASAVMSKELKDTIAKQVKTILENEKAAAATVGNLPTDEDAEQVPPSLDPRFKLFIASSSLSLDTDDGTCALTAGDIVRRTADTPDANNTVAVEVASSKKDDCAMGTASRIALDDLEEMHDSFRQKIDDGLKSLSEKQGKGGIPSGPAAVVHRQHEGEATPDPAVESDLKKQQQAADATEKDVQDISPDGGSTD